MVTLSLQNIVHCLHPNVKNSSGRRKPGPHYSLLVTFIHNDACMHCGEKKNILCDTHWTPKYIAVYRFCGDQILPQLVIFGKKDQSPQYKSTGVQCSHTGWRFYKPLFQVGSENSQLEAKPPLQTLPGQLFPPVYNTFFRGASVLKMNHWKSIAEGFIFMAWHCCTRGAY